MAGFISRSSRSFLGINKKGAGSYTVAQAQSDVVADTEAAASADSREMVGASCWLEDHVMPMNTWKFRGGKSTLP